MDGWLNGCYNNNLIPGKVTAECQKNLNCLTILNAIPMKTVLAILLAAILLQTAAAQDPVYDKNADTSSPRKTVSLKKYGYSDPRLEKVAVIEVLPVQWDTTRLGFVQVGLANKKIEARPATSHRHFLQDYINSQYGAQLKPEGAHLLWAVKDLRINEKSFAMNERGYARLKADAYISADGQQYTLIAAFDTIVMRNGMDVTSRHDENIARVIHLLLQTSLNEGLPLLETTTASLPKATVINSQLSALRMPILDDQFYKEGVYMSYEEFKANKPSITAFHAEKVKKKFSLYSLDAQNNKVPINNAWGFCTKAELYKIDDNNIVPLEKSGNGFIISKYLEDAQRRNKAIFLSTVFGGATGAAIALGATQTYLVRSVPYITKQQPEATALDMLTGELTL